ncbi:MAG TPA: universal stress protein [Solirubrobacteraceae bacterium]|jgi:basic amino acid/polyamine antiporter, APA family|nr:universal stress protein [Solirubrobacteraceae bacterium]
MAERRLHGLQRVLGVNALSSTAYGNVGSSIYYALGLVAALAAGLTPVVFIITGALFYCTATTYAEATAMYPEAGGSSLFARRAFNELASFFTAWAQMLNYIITIAISAFFAAHYAGRITWDGFKGAPWDVVLAAGIVGVLALINVRGVKDAVTVNLVLATVDFLSQLAIVALGFFLVVNPDILLDNLSLFGQTPTLTQFLLAIPIGTVAYTGIETISNMAGEARDSDETVPGAIKRVMIAVFAIYFTLPIVALSALPVECAGGECRTLLGVGPEENGFANDPIIGVVSGMDLGAMQGAAEFYVGVLAVTILIVATNAGVLGVSRLTYSMGLYRQLPDTMRQLHRRYRTPYVGILLFSAFAGLALLPGQADFLGKIYAFGAMLSFSMAHLSVVRLRVIAPDAGRPYRSPGRVRWRGHDLPPFALVGLAGTGLAFVVVSVLDLTVAAAGFAWMALGLTGYVAYRRRQGLDLVSTHQVAVAQPVTEAEAEYDSVLVAFDARRYVPQTVATAVKLAAPRRNGIHVLALVTVPHSNAIDDPLPEEEAAALAVIAQARRRGGRRVTGHVEKVRPGQSGRLIVDEAREMRAQAIVMPLPPRTGTTVFGKTVETVLAERPCRVIIEIDPSDAPAR